MAEDAGTFSQRLRQLVRRRPQPGLAQASSPRRSPVMPRGGRRARTSDALASAARPSGVVAAQAAVVVSLALLVTGEPGCSYGDGVCDRGPLLGNEGACIHGDHFDGKTVVESVVARRRRRRKATKPAAVLALESAIADTLVADTLLTTPASTSARIGAGVPQLCV